MVQKIVLTFGFFLLLGIGNSIAQDLSFRPLFNGKDLTGWVDVNTSKDTWTIKDSTLICTGHPIGVMRTDRQYENFILEIEWKHLEAGGNSGVFIWSEGTPFEGKRLTKAIEVQMLELEYATQHNRTDAYVHGELFPTMGMTAVPDNPRGIRSKSIEKRCTGKGTWNKYVVVCVDGTVKLSVNGKFVNGLSQSERKKGYICLEAEGAEIHFRNIRIMELPAGVTSPEQTAPIIQSGARWSTEKAWEWYDNQSWLVGTNFNPSTAINQLEFWQEETFDITTIDRELSWSADLGMNMHRVYLHNLLWEQDSVGFLKRIEDYLTIADKYGIKTMFVLLDDVWHPAPKLGEQPAPIPFVHNSGWVQAPGGEILGDSTRHIELEGYIKGVLKKFGTDKRVSCWDLYNEPDNVTLIPNRVQLEVKNKHIYSLALLKKVYAWARTINPNQPLTAGLWKGEVAHWGTPDSLSALDKFMVENADVISFHTYDGDMEIIRQKIKELKKYGRPLLCTEYLARGVGNTFQNVLPIFKENKIAAINWGLVSGKTNTIYPWASWWAKFSAEPKIWHHDILNKDGKPYSEEEVKFILKEIKGK